MPKENNRENTLKNFVLGGIFLLPFIGLIVNSAFFFPYITPKNIAFRLIVLVIAAVYAYLVYKNRDYRPTFGSIGVAFSIFILVLFIADIFGQYSLKSFFSNFERMEGFFTLFLLFCYFTILTGVMKTERLWENLLNTSLASSVVMAIYALIQQGKGVIRLDAQLGNSTYLGAFMLFNIFFTLLLIVRHLHRQHSDNTTKWLILGTYGVILILDLYVLYYTGTRGALLGLFVGLLFSSILFAFFQKQSKQLKIAGYVILMGIIVSVGSLFALRNTTVVQNSPLLSRFAQLVAAPTDLSAYATTQGKGRFAIWNIAIEGVKERPVLGWGQENFNYVFNKYYDPNIYDQEQWFDRAHNVFFDWLIAGGFLGLLSYLSMYFLAFYVLWRKKREGEGEHFSFADKTIISALIIGYFIHNFFVFDSITSYILFFTVLGYISVHEKPVDFNKYVDLSFLKGEGVRMTLLTVVFVASSAGLYFLVIAPWIASTTLLKALAEQNQALNPNVTLGTERRIALIRQAAASYKKALRFGPTGSTEVREQLLQNGTTIQLTPGMPEDLKELFGNLVDVEMKKQLEATPEDARPFLFYGSYLSNIGRAEEALPYYERALELSPDKQTFLIERGLAYINLQRYEEGLVFLRRAFELVEENVEARVWYAVGLIYAGQNAEAERLLLPIRETTQGTDIKLIKAYYDTNQANKITELLNIKLLIAERLANQGDKQGAIRQIEEVMSINPAFKEQGEALIQQVQSQ
jgi:O-antigen ligase